MPEPLSPELLKEIREALLSHVGNRAGERDAMLYAALGNSRVRRQIALDGNTVTFVPHLMQTLIDFGRDKDGVPTLAKLLHYLAEEAGIDHAAHLNSLADRVIGTPIPTVPVVINTSNTTYDEAKILTFLEKLAPADFSRILIRLPDSNSHVPDSAGHYTRVTEFMRYIRSSTGPGIPKLVAVLDDLFSRGSEFQRPA